MEERIVPLAAQISIKQVPPAYPHTDGSVNSRVEEQAVGASTQISRMPIECSLRCSSRQDMQSGNCCKTRATA